MPLFHCRCRGHGDDRAGKDGSKKPEAGVELKSARTSKDGR